MDSRRFFTARSDTTRAELYRTACMHGMFVVVPLVLTAWSLVVTFHSVGMRAVDFHHEFWPAARRLLEGQNPYGRSWQNISAGVAFPYPALTAAVFVPFALFPAGMADLLYTAVNLGAIIAALHVLKVRDWRIYGVVLLWAPAVAAWQSANLTLLFVLAIACLWRARERPVVAGLLVAVLVSLKPFIWPLAIWLLATRRWGAVGWTAVWGVLLNLVAWAVVGFSQLDAYRATVQHVSAVMEHRGYALVNLVFHLGGSSTIAYAVTVLATCAALIGCLVMARRENGLPALALAIAAALLATPVAWTHYFALVVVPLALARPRLGPLWLTPVALWLCPSTMPTTWQIVVALVVNATIIGAVVSRPGPAARTRARSPRAVRYLATPAHPS